MNPLALVLENDAGTRKLLDVLLVRNGFEVDAVASGAHALLLLQRIEYAAIFVDLAVPTVSGTDIVRWIARERPEALERTVVVSSAAPRQIQEVRDTWPAVRVYRKPFELSEIIGVAQSVLAGHVTRAGVNMESDDFVRRSVVAGAKAGVIVTTDGATVDRVLDFGYAPGLAASYFPMNVEAPVPVCGVIRNAQPIWLTSRQLAASEYPQLEPAFRSNQSHALAAVPLLRDGHVVGAAGWTFAEPRLFSDAEQRAFATIAARVAGWLPGH